MDANCGIRLVARRLCVAALGTAALSLLWSAPALAQVGAPVIQTTAPVVQAAAPVAQTAAPVVQAAAPVAQTAAPVVQAAAPVAQTATAPVAAPVVETATPILGTAAPVVAPLTAGLEGEALLVVGNGEAPAGIGSLLAARTSPGSSASRLETTGSSTTTVLPVSPGSAPISLGTAPPPTARPVENAGSGLLGADRPARRFNESTGPLAAPLQLSTPLAFPTLASSTGPSGSDAPKGTEARARTAPGPNTPSGPSVPSSAAAVLSGSGASIFVAALVAALVLAVPGLSRRLRLEPAPWPLPTALPSLERPG